MVDIVIEIALKVAECLVAPVGRQLSYLFCYKRNIDELEDELRKLDHERSRWQGSVDDVVQKWLEGANTIYEEAKKIIDDEKKANKSCFKGLCPNLISRYRFSRQAKKKAPDVKKSHEEGDSLTVSHRLPLPGAGSAPLQGYQAFESRASTLEKIMDALRDDKINKIGVWGLGGVGKTTLAKLVAKLAEDDKLFDKVVMVAVSREQKLGKIQEEIADLLGLKFEETSELGRAGRLSETLKKKKLLIILDDIWAKLKLEAVGIPYGEDHKGLKIVVTSRSRDVLSQDMGTQENFEVRLLSGEEAWQLFQDTAGDCIQKFNLQSVAKKVAEECGDLPIAIVTVANALKEKDLPSWEDALRQLRSPTKTDIRGMPDDVYNSLELSYMYLENKDAQSLFLLCGLLGYGDISMDDLFKYSVGLRLFPSPSIRTLEDSANRLQALVDSLKSSSLLLDIHKKEYVKMHDVVRDVARDIASRDPHQFVVIEATQSEDWSEIVRESTRYIHLSSSHQGTLALPERLVCPKLEFFLLVNGGPLKNIPDSFFNAMGKLKVLRLCQMEFSSLSLSLQSLSNLRTLWLDRCMLGDVAGIGKLKQLEVLSFRGSNIQQLPKEIAQLTCLRLLDLNDCKELKVIPGNILSSLSQLECLCMKSSFTQWTAEEASDRESNACLSEINGLSHLTSIEVQIPDAKSLPKEDMFFDNLTRYEILIGNVHRNHVNYGTSRALKLKEVDGRLLLRDGIGKLLTKTEELLLEILKEVCWGPIPERSLVNLKYLSVAICHGMKFLILLSTARGLPQLENIWIADCNDMQQIFGYGRNPEIKEDDNAVNNRQLFPKLRDVRLWNLPEFMNFVYCGSELETTSQGMCYEVSFANLESLEFKNLLTLKEIWHCQLPLDSLSNLQILRVENCPCLINLIPCHLIQSLKNLKYIEVSDCEVLKHVFDLQGLDKNIGILPKLETLKLVRLPRLKINSLFSHFMPKNFSNLKYLSIMHCGEKDKDEGYINTPIEDGVLFVEKVSFSPNLEIDSKRRLLSLSMLKDFHNLKELEIINYAMEEQRDVYTSTNDVVFFDGKVSFPDGVCYEAFESRASTFNKIMDALRDKDISRIGVWGMGGVGKTTLLKQVARQAKKQIYIDGSWTRDSDKLQQGIDIIQQKIADFFSLEVEEVGELIQLKNHKILIILDDIWKEIDLKEVGIPSAGECKILLSSRDGDLLCKDMGAQICFQVEHLLPQEAWSLFKKTAGDSVEENLELRPIAKKVVEEYCEGIPIAILTIAKALKDETMAVWKNVLEELEELKRSAPTNIRGVGNKVYSILEWSYTHLKGDDVKSLFLLCGMLGCDDISVDLLLQYCLGWDMFDHIDSLDQATNKFLTLVQILKTSNLLFFNADNQSVRMHDVVIDVAKAIASKDPHPFVVREDVGFEEWSETDESKRCTFISLNCKLVPELPQGLVCPELQIFLLQNNNPSLNIPNTFFEGMKKLKVLDLSETNFVTLPSSLDSLANLQTLRLDGCELVDIAFIGKLTKLEVLSLVGSTIQQLPEEMAQLNNLRLLDLNDCEELEVIPRHILSSLSRLECLCMKSSFTGWADEGESNASLSELKHLASLTTLEIDIPDAELLPTDILFESLIRYTIFVGDLEWLERDCKTKRALKLERVFLHLGDGISKLLERSEEMEFVKFSGTNYVLYPSDRESFVELKHLKVGWSDEIQYIIDSKDQRFLQHGAFPLLESLVIEELENLEEVWHGSIPIGSFGNLKTLKMSVCPKLKFLFLLSTARGLSQLEKMKIEDCNVMQQIIAYEKESEIKEEGYGGTNLQLFPKLRTLKLKSLPQLINFTPGLETTSSTSLSTNAMSTSSIFNHEFSFPILEKLILIDLPKLKDIWFHQLLSRSCNLQTVKMSDCPYQLNLVSSHLKKIDVQNCNVM